MDIDIPEAAADRASFLAMLTATPDTTSEHVHVVWHPRYRPLLGHKVRRRPDGVGERAPDRCG